MKNLTKKQKSILLTNTGKLRSQMHTALHHFPNPGNAKFTGKIYPNTWTGSGRRFNLASSSKEVLDILGAFKLKFTKGNDAPRGGMEDEFIKVSRSACKKMNLLLTELTL